MQGPLCGPRRQDIAPTAHQPDSSPALTHGGTRMWLAVAVVVGAGVVAAVQVGKAAIAMPLLQADLGIGLAEAGRLMAVVALIGALGGTAAGALASVDDRRVLLGGLLAIVLAGAAGAMSPSLRALMIARFVEGVGFLSIAVAGPAILQRIVPANRRDIAFALWSCFMPAGMALAMVGGPWFDNWRAIWWASAVLAVALLTTAVLAIPRAARHDATLPRGPTASRIATLRRPRPWLLGACFALYSLMFFALFSFLPVLLIDRMGAGHAAVGGLTALAIAANIAGNLGAGWLLARGLSRPALVACASAVMGLSGLGIFLPLFGDLPTFLLCVLFSAVGGLIPATLIASAPLVAPSSAALPVVIGLLMQGSNLGQAVGPVTVGAAIEAHGWTGAAAVVLAAALGAAWAGRALRGDRRA